jgi:hypothetical protein
VKKTTFLIKIREAVGDNAPRVLNIDGGAPGRMYACIDEAAQEEITDQLAKRVDTSDVIAPEREGYAVDVVTFNATLRELFTAGHKGWRFSRGSPCNLKHSLRARGLRLAVTKNDSITEAS